MTTNPSNPRTKFNGLWFAALLAAILGALFWQSFTPGVVHFSNDGPLGIQNADVLDLPQGITGIWFDLNSIGFASGAFTANITTLLKWVLGPVGISKFLAPVALFILGMGAWMLFRQLRFSPVACALGGFAAALSSVFVSTACWGVASQQIAMGMNFVAVSVLIASFRARTATGQILRLVLAGACVGLSIMEGLDNGALFSICVAALTVFLSIVRGPGPWWRCLLAGAGRTAIIAICSALVAAQTLATLVTTQIIGAHGSGEDDRTPQQHWDFITQWSFPKKEVLTFAVPGLFGFRMDTPEGGNYWGAIGRDPAWDRYFASDRSQPPPAGSMRFSGGGAYLGVPVVLILCWTVWQAFRRKDSVFAPDDRRLLWFWIAASVVTLLLAFGRFAPFFKVFYALPYLSMIRNPVKFTAIFNFAAVVLFAYGVNALWARYVTPANPQRVPGDRRWILGMFIAIAVSFIGWIVYAASQKSLVEYLQTVQFDAELARMIAKFSIKQVGIFIAFLVASVVLMTAILKGKFAGEKAKTAGILLGILMVVDLGLANLPWTVFVNYQMKYESNPIVDQLREKPYENRVAILPFRANSQEDSYFERLYRIEWAQHHFPYYNIQSLDVVQMPRPPQDLVAFETALHFNGSPESAYLIPRRWALTSTRYLLGSAGYVEALNSQMDRDKRRFRIAQTFSLGWKPGVTPTGQLEELTVHPSTNGQLALIEFTGALPRASLFSNWLVPAKNPDVTQQTLASLTTNELSRLESVGTNDFLTLKLLASRDFDPSQLVLVADTVPVPEPPATNNATAGTVEYTHYSPKNIRLKAQAHTAAMLLLNDKYDANWKVSVDGKPAELLRCNFLMRGVYLTPGMHEVEFVFRSDLRPLYVTLAAMIVCGILAGIVVVEDRRTRSSTDENHGR
ncbi:MAG TPA: hypothetical protein VEH04_13835 [Verrucomicrobiae bacterium]|nr:hypothetical protein [Verrucomicrobiae bacterium]